VHVEFTTLPRGPLSVIVLCFGSSAMMSASAVTDLDQPPADAVVFSVDGHSSGLLRRPLSGTCMPPPTYERLFII